MLNFLCAAAEEELEDFIVILEKKFYNALLQNKGKPSVPEIDWAMLDRIEQDIKKNIPYKIKKGLCKTQSPLLRHKYE